ncbi:hypothetical protein U9M48_023082, partial [Paspalum notatum var. saurae]
TAHNKHTPHKKQNKPNKHLFFSSSIQSGQRGESGGAGAEAVIPPGDLDSVVNYPASKKRASKMRGFVDPFVPAPAWPPQADNIALACSPWTCTGGGGASSLADAAGAYLAAAPDDQDAEFRLDNGSSPALLLSERFLNAQRLQDEDVARGLDGFQQLDDGGGALLAGALLGTHTPCATMSVADDSAAPVVCSSNEDSSGSDHSVLPQFLLGVGVGEQPVPATAPAAASWPSTAFAQISSLVGPEEITSQGFAGFVAGSEDGLLLDACRADGNKYLQQHQHDDVEFNTGKMLSFAPAPGQQANTTNFSQKEPSGLHHLNLSSLVAGQLSSFSAAGSGHNPKQSNEGSGGKIGLRAPPFGARSELPNGNGVAGSGAPKPRVRARRGQATDPHSIAERLRREKISDRMKNLQELVPNSNRTDKASMLDEIIEYVKFLQLQVKVLSMSRLGATEAVVPLLTESQTESSGGLLLSPRSAGRQQAGGVLGQPEPRDGGAAFEQEVVQLMENNMTTAMQYLQSKGLCLMPIALASAISDQKGTSTSSAAVRPRPENDGEAEDEGAGGEECGDAKEMMRALVPLGGGPREMRSRA